MGAELYYGGHTQLNQLHLANSPPPPPAGAAPPGPTQGAVSFMSPQFADHCKCTLSCLAWLHIVNIGGRETPQICTNMHIAHIGKVNPQVVMSCPPFPSCHNLQYGTSIVNRNRCLCSSCFFHIFTRLPVLWFRQFRRQYVNAG